MKKLFIAIAMLAITSCTTIHTNTIINNAPTPPKLSSYCDEVGCDYRRYADDLNWYMIYAFTYTKAVNEYAMAKGWTPPKVPPVCRKINWPKPEKFPDFKPSPNYHSVHDFEWQLTQYIKKLRKSYSEHIEDVDNAVYLQRTLCTY